MSIELTLLSKPGCHLCEEARDVVDGVMQEFIAANPAISLSLNEINILEDDSLRARYAEEIPVLLINDKVHNYWRIDDERLMRALYALAK